MLNTEAQLAGSRRCGRWQRAQTNAAAGQRQGLVCVAYRILHVPQHPPGLRQAMPVGRGQLDHPRVARQKLSDGMALALIDILLAGSAQFLHVIVGAFGVPLGMIFSPDAYYVALLPVIRDVAVAAGCRWRPLEAVARAMLIGENTGLAISPVVPSVYLALALVIDAGQI